MGQGCCYPSRDGGNHSDMRDGRSNSKKKGGQIAAGGESENIFKKQLEGKTSLLSTTAYTHPVYNYYFEPSSQPLCILLVCATKQSPNSRLSVETHSDRQRKTSRKRWMSKPRTTITSLLTCVALSARTMWSRAVASRTQAMPTTGTPCLRRALSSRRNL